MEDSLSRYASVYWGLHCEQSRDRSKIKQPVLEFLFAKEHFQDCLDDMQKALQSFKEGSSLSKKLRDTVSDPVSPLFAVSCFGLVEVFDEDAYSAEVADLNLLNINGTSCLYLASRWGHTRLVEIFLDREADINIPGGQFGSAIQAASFAGHIESVRVLLSRGAFAFNAGEFPDAIQAALAGGFENIAYLLLQAGYKSAKECSLSEIRTFASFGGHVEIIKLLANYQHLEGGRIESPLQNALFNGKGREAQRLLAHTLDINANEGLFGNSLQAAIFSDSLDLVKLIVAKGAKIDHHGTFGYALRAAAVRGHEDTVSYLIQMGADYNIEDQHLGDCLQAAASQNHCAVISLLIEHGANIEGQSPHHILFKGNGVYGTPLQAACFNGHLQAVQILLNNGARLSSPGRFEHALSAAVHGNQTEVVPWLLDVSNEVRTQYLDLQDCLIGSSGKPELLYQELSPEPWGALPSYHDFFDFRSTSIRIGLLEIAASNGNVSLMDTLLKAGARVTNYENITFTALQIASLQGHKSSVRFLLEKKADLNVVRNAIGTALHAAICAQNFVIAELLLGHGCNVDEHWQTGPRYSFRKDYGSPLQVASEQGNMEAVRFLCNHGANINDPGGQNGTALQVASDAGHLDIVRFLLDNGTNAFAPGRSKGNALLAAFVNGHYDIVAALLFRSLKLNRLYEKRDILVLVFIVLYRLIQKGYFRSLS